MDAWLQQLVGDARAGRFPDLAGTRVSADVAISDTLVNRAIAAKLGANAPVREVQVRARHGHARVDLRLTRPKFLPPLAATIRVDRQPDMASSPVVIFRWSMLPGVAALVGAGLSFLNVLPRGYRIDGDRLFVDLAALLEQQGQAALLPAVQSARISFDEGRIVLHLELHLSE